METTETTEKLGLLWFFRNPNEKKYRKILFVAFFGTMFLAYLWTLSVVFQPNQFPSIQFWSDFSGIMFVTSIVIGTFCGYILTWLSYPGKESLLAAVLIGLVALFLSFMILTNGLSSLMDLVTNAERQSKEYEFSIVEPNITYKACKFGMIIDAPSPFRSKICGISARIRTHAKVGDTIVLLGEESYWVFRMDRVRLVPK